jgi:ABC-type amino acid transport substrate-binding protein
MRTWSKAAAAAAVAALAVTAAGGASATPLAQSAAAAPTAGDPTTQYHLVSNGTLTVGMTLLFKPEMYLDKGKPAGYDVELVKALAKSMGVKLKIQNLAFDGLIAGLQAKKFDMVSVGLSPTPERKKAVSFSRAYVPYALILAVPKGDTTAATVAAWNSSDKTITALQGSTDADLIKKTFPKAKLKTFPDDNAALLEVATGRADASVVENYILADFSKSNPGKLKQAAFKKPLDLQYGAYATQKGNTALVGFLNKWICKVQKNGSMASIYKKTQGATLPPMPAC